MVMVILRATVRAGAGDEFEKVLASAYDVALATHGFVVFDRYESQQGEHAMLLEFESHEALAAWRDDPGNAATQRADRDRLFSSYRIQVCDVVREYDFAPQEE